MDTDIFRQGMELIAGQDPVFLGAAVAVAAGTALLTGTLFAYFRGRRRTGANGRVAPRKPASASVADIYVPSSSGMAQPAQVAPGAGDSALPLEKDLLVRLRRTVDRLEKLQEELLSERSVSAESPLKPTPPAVEYVFRKGIG